MPDNSDDVPMDGPPALGLGTPPPTNLLVQQRRRLGPIHRDLGPEPNQAESSRSHGKRKHPDEGPGLQSNTDSSPNAKKARTGPADSGQAQPRTKAGMKAKKEPREKRPNEWQVLRGEVKKEERGTKVCFQVYFLFFESILTKFLSYTRTRSSFISVRYGVFLTRMLSPLLFPMMIEQPMPAALSMKHK